MEGDKLQYYALKMPTWFFSGKNKVHSILFKTTGKATSSIKCRSASYRCENGLRLNVGLNFYPSSPEDEFEIFDKNEKRLETFSGSIYKEGFSGLSNDFKLDEVYFVYSGMAKSKLDVTRITCYTS